MHRLAESYTEHHIRVACVLVPGAGLWLRLGAAPVCWFLIRNDLKILGAELGDRARLSRAPDQVGREAKHQR